MDILKNKKASPSKGFQKFLVLGALAMSASAIPFTNAMALDDNALPEGGNVVNGSATLDYSARNQLDIYQNSDRVVINWNSFNIGVNAFTRFFQPSSNSIAVNRVTGSNVDPSLILGSLSANGKVFVLDQNGVIFGQNSRVDVGSIVVGTGTIDDNAFMAGDNVLTMKDINPNSAIINNGTMTIRDAGLAAFVAPTLINNGIIQANMGYIALASGTKVTIDLYGDRLVEVATDIPLDHALIENNGTMNAEGGKVLLSADAAKDIVDNIINMSGTINVSSVTQRGGKIILEGTDTKISGTLDASGKTGGGTIHIGGEYQGGGTTRHAQNTTIKNTAKIYANTTGTDGNGGEVIIWSDKSTRMDGAIEAKAGTLSGNGGLVETSGKINLGISGSVDASAPNGASGQWLLDPSNVTIHSTAGTNIPVGGGTINPPSDSYVITDSSIEAALNAGNNVTITTTNGGGSQTGYIDFDWGGVSINKTTGASATLTLKANANINFANSNIRSTGAGNALNVVAWSNFDGVGNDGRIEHYGTILTNGGNISLVGGLDDGANGGVVGDGIGDNFTGDSIALSGADINAQGGNILINSSDVDNIGLLIQSGTQLKTNGNGNIKITGIGTSVGFGWAAGILHQSGSSIETQFGTIDMTGTNTAATGQGIGLSITGNSTISTTGTTGGSITINGTRTGSGNNNATGVSMDGDASRIFTNNGNITITGIGTTSTAGVSGYGFNLTNGADIYSTGNGIVNLTGTGTTTTGTAGDFVTSGTGTSEIGKSTSTNALTLNMNIIDLGNIGSVLRTQGILTVKPRAISTTIGLGGGAGILNLTDTELGYITAGTLIIGDSVAGTGDIDLDSWDLSTKTFNTELYGNDITIRDIGNAAGYSARLGSGNFMAYAQDNDIGLDKGSLDVQSPITKNIAGTSLLNLRADKDISLHTVTSATGSLNTIINADRDADLDGSITLGGNNIITNGGYLIAGGGSGNVDSDGNGIFGDAGTGADYAYAQSSTTGSGILINTNINLGGGSAYINGSGWMNATCNNNCWGVSSSTKTLQTTGSGSFNVRGLGGGTSSTQYTHAIKIENGGSISTLNGDINLTGVTTSTNSNATGLSFGSAATLTTAGTGSINLTSSNSFESYLTQSVFTSANDITLIADMFIGSMNLTMNAADKLIFKPRTSSTNIMLGGTSNWAFTDTLLSNISATTLIVGDSTNGTGDIAIESWNLSSKSFNVELYGNDITVQDTAGAAGYGMRLDSGNFMAHAMDKDTPAIDKADISINAAITKSVAGSSLLDLRSDRDILVSTGGITSTTGTLNTILNSDRDADSDGRIYINTNITTNNGYLVGGGGTDPVNTYTHSVSTALGIELSSMANLVTGSGNITFHGQNSFTSPVANLFGFYMHDGARMTTISGDINILGIGGNGTIENYGVFAQAANTVISTTSGTINITGVGGNGSSHSNSGVRFRSGAKIESTGTGSNIGSINVTATAGGTGASSLNIQDIETKDANIHFKSMNQELQVFAANTVKTAGTDSARGNFTIEADKVYIEAGSSVDISGTLLIKPLTTSESIGIGGGSGNLNLNDAELTTLSAGRLVIGDSVNGTGDIDIQTWDLSSKTHNVQIHGKNINLGGITTGTGNVFLYAKGGSITASTDSNSNAAGDITLLSTHDVAVNETIANAGTGKINIFAGWDGSSGITTPALFNLDNINLGVTARNITIGANGNLSSAGTGTSVLLVAKGAFVNNGTAGVNAISALGGRYLVYSDNPTNTMKNGLNAKSLYNKTYPASAPSSISGGSRFVYNFQPTATITADSFTALDIGSANYTYSVSGLINGDLAADALSGSPLYIPGTRTGNTYPIQLSAGTMTSPEGYALSYVGGMLTVTTPLPLATDGTNLNLNGAIMTYTSNVIEVAKAEETPKTPNNVSKEAKDVEKGVPCLVSDATGCILR